MHRRSCDGTWKTYGPRPAEGVAKEDLRRGQVLVACDISALLTNNSNKLKVKKMQTDADTFAEEISNDDPGTICSLIACGNMDDITTDHIARMNQYVTSGTQNEFVNLFAALVDLSNESRKRILLAEQRKNYLYPLAMTLKDPDRTSFDIVYGSLCKRLPDLRRDPLKIKAARDALIRLEEAALSEVTAMRRDQSMQTAHAAVMDARTQVERDAEAYNICKRQERAHDLALRDMNALITMLEEEECRYNNLAQEQDLRHDRAIRDHRDPTVHTTSTSWSAFFFFGGHHQRTTVVDPGNNTQNLQENHKARGEMYRANGREARARITDAQAGRLRAADLYIDPEVVKAAKEKLDRSIAMLAQKEEALRRITEHDINAMLASARVGSADLSHTGLGKFIADASRLVGQLEAVCIPLDEAIDQAMQMFSDGSYLRLPPQLVIMQLGGLVRAPLYAAVLSTRDPRPALLKNMNYQRLFRIANGEAL